MKKERSDFGKTKVVSPTESNVKIEQVIYFKYKNMLHNISDDCGMWRLWCNSTEDESEKSTFCHFSSVHPFGRLWALAKATRFFNCLLFRAGFLALIRPWRPFRDWIRIRTVLVDTGTSGDQVSWRSAAVEKGLALDFRANKRSSRAVVLRGLPDLGLSKKSPVSSYLFLILCTWRWDTLKVSATSAVDLVFSLLIISTLVSGWILGMLSEVKLQLMWRSGVLGFFLYPPQELIDQLLVTGEALI